MTARHAQSAARKCTLGKSAKDVLARFTRAQSTNQNLQDFTSQPAQSGGEEKQIGSPKAERRWAVVQCERQGSDQPRGQEPHDAQQATPVLTVDLRIAEILERKTIEDMSED